MRIALLTTDTLPHRRFATAVAKHHELAGVLIETDAMHAPFPVSHPFEDRRKAYEREAWSAETLPALRDMAPTVAFPRLSTAEGAHALKNLNADLAIVFGTRRLSGPILDVLGRHLINLHCGEPQEYRGLDTDLWAIYHGDYAALLATVQYLAPEVNTGAVLARHPVPLHKGMELHQLRYAVTEAFIVAGESAIDSFAAGSMLMITPLQRLGRKYSFMPSVLKDVCVGSFHRHTETLA